MKLGRKDDDKKDEWAAFLQINYHKHHSNHPYDCFRHSWDKIFCFSMVYSSILWPLVREFSGFSGLLSGYRPLVLRRYSCYGLDGTCDDIRCSRICRRVQPLSPFHHIWSHSQWGPSWGYWLALSSDNRGFTRECFLRVGRRTSLFCFIWQRRN
jgi:hypothetical protein